MGIRGATGGAWSAKAPSPPAKLGPAGRGALALAGPFAVIGLSAPRSGGPRTGALSRSGVPVLAQSPAGLAGDCARAGAPDESIPQAATGVAAERIKTVMSTDDRKWVTRKDAAALARCSQDSIVRAQTKHKLQTRTNDAKATLLNTDDLVRVGLIRAEDLAAGATGAECAELARTKEQVSQLRTEVGRQGGRLAEREAFLDLLRQQVGEKDRQIRLLQATIDLRPAPIRRRG